MTFSGCCFWRKWKKREEEKSGRINSGKIAYYGDYGMDQNIYGENGVFPVKKQERLVKEAMEEQEKATLKMVKNLKFAIKK
ncbi:hypothetical protein ACS0TY_011872 [Phlomoides rotata]